jgi:hypothetical protein
VSKTNLLSLDEATVFWALEVAMRQQHAAITVSLIGVVKSESPLAPEPVFCTHVTTDGSWAKNAWVSHTLPALLPRRG